MADSVREKKQRRTQINVHFSAGLESMSPGEQRAVGLVSVSFLITELLNEPA